MFLVVLVFFFFLGASWCYILLVTSTGAPCEFRWLAWHAAPPALSPSLPPLCMMPQSTCAWGWWVVGGCHPPTHPPQKYLYARTTFYCDMHINSRPRDTIEQVRASMHSGDTNTSMMRLDPHAEAHVNAGRQAGPRGRPDVNWQSERSRGSEWLMGMGRHALHARTHARAHTHTQSFCAFPGL